MSDVDRWFGLSDRWSTLALVTNQGGIVGSSSCSSSPRGPPADTAQLWSRLFLRTLSAPPKPLAHTLSYLTQPNQVLLTYRKLITLPSCGAGSSFAQRSAQTTRTHTPLLSYANKPNQTKFYTKSITLVSVNTKREEHTLLPILPPQTKLLNYQNYNMDEKNWRSVTSTFTFTGDITLTALMTLGWS